MDEQKTADNVLDCAVNFLDEVAALVGSDEILAETANILLRQKDAEGSDLIEKMSKKSKGTVEALLLELTDPSDELIYDGISVINTVNSGPSDRIMYAMINNSGYAAGDAFLEQAKKSDETRREERKSKRNKSEQENGKYDADSQTGRLGSQKGSGYSCAMRRRKRSRSRSF
jgi:dihydrofolate reductase